jgi:hypothetical protein
MKRAARDARERDASDEHVIDEHAEGEAAAGLARSGLELAALALQRQQRGLRTSRRRGRRWRELHAERRHDIRF